jgi:hypothetical protein
MIIIYLPIAHRSICEPGHSLPCVENEVVKVTVTVSRQIVVACEMGPNKGRPIK